MAETIWNSAVSVYHFMMDNLVVINILLSLVIVFFQRRSPQTVWTWLLLLYFIPILGFVLYLLIGQDFHKSRMFKAKEIEGEIKYAVRRQEETIYRRRLRLTNPAVARYRDLILYNLEAGQAVLTDNNDVRIYTDGKEKFKALLEEMKKAKKYIHFQLKYQSGNLLLHMKNSKRAGNNAKLQTEKTDTRKHGRGLRSVKRTAEKYGGSLFLEDKGDLFETKLMLTGIAELLGSSIVF